MLQDTFPKKLNGITLSGIVVFLLCTPLLLQAQDSLSLDAFNADRLRVTRGGMTVLGSWAAGNLAFSGVQYFRTEGSTKYFHQMNFMWNIVNAGLAAGGYFGASPGSAEGLSLSETLAEQHGIEKMLLVNAGLDVGYIMTGFFLRERSKTATKRNDLLKGYGNSLILQGGFLLLFDSVFYLVEHSNGKQGLGPILEHVTVGPGTLGMQLTF